MNANKNISRRDLLATAAASLPLLSMASNAASATAEEASGTATGSTGAKGMNVVIFLTDQQRKVMHFRVGWEQANLPGMTRLKRHGLSFENAFTNACMCSPARATLMSGYFPAQTRVKYTLEQSMKGQPGKYPQFPLPHPTDPLQLKNIATVMSAAGYDVIYKGKWHLDHYQGARFVPFDVNSYGFQRWDPQDAGANQNQVEEGGGIVNNDARFMYENGPIESGHEGVLAYLRSVAKNSSPQAKPFCLIVSLVNPHDVLSYPNNYSMFGYDDAWLKGDVQPPATTGENLDTKPIVQKEFLALTNAALGQLKDVQMQKNYLNFYGNLMKLADGYLVEILDTLDSLKLTDNTLVIQSSDHGEMGLTHGGQRQKCFNFYEETLNVPLIYSNPRLYPSGRTSNALVSHVDFLPTLANLFDVPFPSRSNWQGVDYSQIVLNPSTPPVQDYIVFTYDDYQCGQPQGPYTTPPNHIVSLREVRYKLAEYYDADGHIPSQWEMYDLLTDPLEEHNIAFREFQRTNEQQRELDRLKLKLERIKQTRLQPLP